MKTIFAVRSAQACRPHPVPARGDRAPQTGILLAAAAANGLAVVDPAGTPLAGSPLRGGGAPDDAAVTLLPWWNFTAPLHYLHAHDRDCTHFCYAPHLWYTTWRHLRNAMERLARREEEE